MTRTSQNDFCVKTPFPIAEDIKALTGIRFFAAIWVVLHHFRGSLRPISVLQPFMPLFDQGYLAVPMFFILSGFILSHTYFPRYSLKSHAEFIYRRFARVWPMHVVSLLVLMTYMAVSVAHSGRFEDESGTFAWQDLPSELVMVRSWFSKDLVWNYPAWSIHAEWFAYLFLFPIGVLTFPRISNRWMILLVIAILLAAQTFLPVGQVPGMCAEIFFLFLIGSGLYRLRQLFQDSRGTWVASFGLLLFVVAVSGLFPHTISVIYIAFACLIFGLSYTGGWLDKLLSRRPFVYGGLISYSLYMTHAVVLKFVNAGFHKIGIYTQGQRIAGVMVFVVAMLITASFFYHAIEVPCNRVLRRNSPFALKPMPRPESSALLGWAGLG